MLTPEQVKLRKTGIGGSDAAALVGQSAYATPLDVYLDKTTDQVKDSNEAMERGNALEPFVKALFEHQTGFSVETELSTQRSPDHPFMLAHLDGFLPSERSVAEFKTALYTPKTKDAWGIEGTDEIPNNYLIQVAHYASVMDVERVYIGVLFGDEKHFQSYRKLQALVDQKGYALSKDDLDELRCDFRVYVYQRHADLTRKLIKKERSFWFDHVQKRIPPNPQEDSVDDILKAYPQATDKSVVCLDEEDVARVQNLIQIKCQIKELEKQEEVAKARVMSLFGDASILLDASHTPLATWKNKITNRFDKTAFAKEHPALCDLFTKSSTTRELRLM